MSSDNTIKEGSINHQGVFPLPSTPKPTISVVSQHPSSRLSELETLVKSLCDLHGCDERMLYNWCQLEIDLRKKVTDTKQQLISHQRALEVRIAELTNKIQQLENKK